MSKKHFIELANRIMEHNRLYPVDKFSQNQLATLAGFCARQNGNFLRDRWLGYIAGECGPGGGKPKKEGR